jgi:hypothetical protein
MVRHLLVNLFLAAKLGCKLASQSICTVVSIVTNLLTSCFVLSSTRRFVCKSYCEPFCEPLIFIFKIGGACQYCWHIIFIANLFASLFEILSQRFSVTDLRHACSRKVRRIVFQFVDRWFELQVSSIITSSEEVNFKSRILASIQAKYFQKWL